MQHVPAVFGFAPFGEFVDPGGVKLRAAQGFRVVAAEGLRDGAVGPGELHLGGLKTGAFVVAVDGEQAGDAFDHDVADVA